MKYTCGYNTIPFYSNRLPVHGVPCPYDSQKMLNDIYSFLTLIEFYG